MADEKTCQCWLSPLHAGLSSSTARARHPPQLRLLCSSKDTEAQLYFLIWFFEVILKKKGQTKKNITTLAVPSEVHAGLSSSTARAHYPPQLRLLSSGNDAEACPIVCFNCPDNFFNFEMHYKVKACLLLGV